VTAKGRLGATVDAVDFLKAQEGSTSAYASIAADFAAKVNKAALFTAANATERDITKLVSAITGVDTDAAAISAAAAAATAAAEAKAAAEKVAADAAAAAKTAADAAAATAAATAAAEAKAAAEKVAADAAAAAKTAADAAAATAAAEAKAAAEKVAADAAATAAAKAAADAAAAKTAADAALAAVDNTTYASEQAALDAANAAAATAAAAAKAEADAAAAKAAADLAAANATITSLQNPAGTTAALTSSTDTKVGVAGGNDNFTGTTTTIGSDGDVVVDGSSTDNDTLSLTLTAALGSTDFAIVSGIENVNINWNAFGTATVNAEDIKGATITVSSTKTGYLGNATVSKIGSNDVVFSTNVDGTLTASDITDASITARNGGDVVADGTGTAADNLAVTVTGGTTVVIGGTNALLATTVVADANTTDITVTGQGEDSTISITDGAATDNITAQSAQTVTITSRYATTVVAKGDTGGNNDSTLTVSALSADDIELVGTTGDDTATVTTNAAEVTFDLDTGVIDALNINAAANAELTLETGAEFGELTVASTGSVTLISSSAILDAETVNDSTAGLSVDLTSSGAHDLSLVDASFNLVTSSAHALTFAKTVSVSVAGDVDVDGSQVFDGTGTSTSTGTITLEIIGDQGTLTTTDFASTVINAYYDADGESADTDDSKITFGTIDPQKNLTLTADHATIITSIAAGTDTATVSVAGALTLSGVTAGTLNLAGTTGATSVTDSGDADFTVTGGAAANTITFASTSNNVVYTGSTGVDTVTLVTTTGNSTLELSTGNNVVTNTALTSGTLTVVAGSGNDTVTTGANATTANITVSLGDGTNTLNLSDGAGVAVVNFTGGAGNDTVSFKTTINGANQYTFTFGDGLNTIDLSNAANIDIDSVVLTVSGLDVVKFNSSGDVINGKLIDDSAVEIRGDGNVSDLLTVTIDTAGNYDFSNVSINSTISLGAGGLAVDASGLTTANTTRLSAGNDTFLGSSGVDTITGGAGNNTITGNDGADVITTGAGSDIVIITNDDARDTITDFSVTYDVLHIDVSGIGSDLVDGNGDSLVADTSITLQSQTSTAGTDIAVTTQILVFTNTLADADALEEAVELLNFAAAGTPADNDDILVAWTDGTYTYLSSVDVLITTDAIDTASATTLVRLTGVAIADIVAGNFTTI
jgi:Ca2+-binding RTX toxin-like protein